MICVGDRVRWVAPEDAVAHCKRVGFPVEGEDTVVRWTIPYPQPGGYVQLETLGYGISVTWCTLVVRDVPAPGRASCRWCHGTGVVLMLFSNVPCECSA